MNERLVPLQYTITDPDETAAVSALAVYDKWPVSATIVKVVVAPFEDDAGATLDINDDGSATAIVALDASDKDVPGEWTSTHFGGTNEPVAVAADSVITLDINSGAAANRFDVTIWALLGE